MKNHGCGNQGAKLMARICTIRGRGRERGEGERGEMGMEKDRGREAGR